MKKQFFTIIMLIAGIVAAESIADYCLIITPKGKSIKEKPQISITAACGDPIQKFNAVYADSGASAADYILQKDNEGTTHFIPKH